MKNLVFSFLILFGSTFTVRADETNMNPSQSETAIKLANQAYQELDRSQKMYVNRRDPERSACNFLGRLFGLYKIKNETPVKVTQEFHFDKNGKELPPTIFEVLVPSFFNENINSIKICHPNLFPATYDRKNTMIILKREINRIEKSMNLK